MYVDCSAAKGGYGSADHPFNDVASASRVRLGPGDSLRFRRGSTCRGMLTPVGSGAPGKPVTIGAYGSASDALPVITGGSAKAAVWLADLSYVTVADLALSNTGDSKQLHDGMYFTSDKSPVTGITIRDLVVDHVDSLSSFDGGKHSGGIVGETLSPTGRFSDVLIENNAVRHASRQGITVYGSSVTSTRPAASAHWPQGSSGVVIRGNHVAQIAGDGIVALGTDGARIERNVVQEVNLSGRNFLAADRNCSAGVWAFDANNTLIQYNEVSDSRYGPSTKPGALDGCDGTAFDVDGHQDGTIVQYNYSHDNAGGFILLCLSGGTTAEPNPPHHGEVRFNLSVDDAATFNPSPCAGDFDPAVNNLDGIRLYNNTFVAPLPRVTLELGPPIAGYYGESVFDNNIVYATAPGAPKDAFACGSSCANNVFFNMPAPATATKTLTSDPQFVDPTRRGAGFEIADAFRLQPTSVAFGAGAPTPAGSGAPATRDFFGNALAQPPTIGFAAK